MGGRARPGGSTAAAICATISRSRSKKPSRAARRKSACRRSRAATPATAAAPRPARSRSTCPTCRGQGRVRAQQGFFTIERTCPACHGAGQVIDDPCRACGGQGRVRKEKTLSVTIPPGVEDGTRIRLAGEGEAGMRGGRGRSLHLPRRSSRTGCSSATAPTSIAACRSRCRPRRSAARSRCRPSTAAAAKVTIPAGTQSGHQFRLRGKGMSVLRSDGPRRHVRPGQCRDAGQADQAPAGTAARVREGGRQPRDESRRAKASSPK